MKPGLVIAALLMMPISFAMQCPDLSITQESLDAVEYWNPQISSACAANLNCIALTKAIIFLESAGTRDAVSHDALVGLMGISAPLAKSYPDLFTDIADWCHYPSSMGMLTAQTHPCPQVSDDRIDPSKNIAAGVRYLKLIESTVGNNVFITAIAWFDSLSAARTISESGKDPSLQEVHKAILDTFRGMEAREDIGITCNAGSLFQRFGGVLKLSREPVEDIGEERLNLIEYAQRSAKERVGLIGIYSVVPSFSLILPAKTEYDTIRTQTSALVESCTSSQSLDSCINDYFVSLSKPLGMIEPKDMPLWKTGPCEQDAPKREAKNTLLGSFDACIRSSQDNCLCELQISSLSGASFAIDVQDGYYSVDGASPMPGFLKLDGRLMRRVSFLGSDNQIIASFQGASGGAALTTSLFLKEGSNITFSSRDYPKDTPICKIDHRVRQFCVQSASSYINSTGDGFDPVYYRFAIDFS